jgi:hypothetical protein
LKNYIKRDIKLEVSVATKIVSDDISLLALLEILLIGDDNAPVLESEVPVGLRNAFLEFEWFDEATIAIRENGCLWVGWDCLDAFSPDYQPQKFINRFRRAGINEISAIFMFADSVQLTSSTEKGELHYVDLTDDVRAQNLYGNIRECFTML